MRMFKKPREPSVRGIMYSSFFLGLTLTIIKTSPSNIMEFILLAGSGIAFATQFLLFTYINEAVQKREYKRIIKPLAIITLPYILPLLAGRWIHILAVMILKGVLFILTGLSVEENARRSIFSYLMGTALITTSYLEPPIYLGVNYMEIYYLWILVATYYTSTSYYIESRLSFREIKPIYPLLTWIWIIPIIYILYPTPFIFIPLIEPTIKQVRNIIKNIKVEKGADIVRMGKEEMRRGYLFTILLIISFLLSNIESLKYVNLI